MKIYQLDQEEEQILKAFEEGKLVRVKNFAKEKKLYEAIARNTSNKAKNINIRLSEKDLHKIKVKAEEDAFLIRLWLAQFCASLLIKKQVLACKNGEEDWDCIKKYQEFSSR